MSPSQASAIGERVARVETQIDHLNETLHRYHGESVSAVADAKEDRARMRIEFSEGFKKLEASISPVVDLIKAGKTMSATGRIVSETLRFFAPVAAVIGALKYAPGLFR